MFTLNRYKLGSLYFIHLFNRLRLSSFTTNTVKHAHEDYTHVDADSTML